MTMKSPQIAAAAFTLIELLVVMSVIAVLAAMSVPGLVGALRSGQVARAAGTIVEVANQARLAALNSREPAVLAGESGPRCYGVVVVDDPAVSSVPFAALTWGAQGDGASNDRGRIQVRDPATGALSQAWRQPGWQPVLQRDLGSVADVLAGSAELRDSAERDVGWCYQYRTGLPIARCASPATAAPIAVGVRTASYADLYGIPGYNPAIAVVAPPASGSDYGLVLRSRDGRLRNAVTVQPSGLAWAGRF